MSLLLLLMVMGVEHQEHHTFLALSKQKCLPCIACVSYVLGGKASLCKIVCCEILRNFAKFCEILRREISILHLRTPPPPPQ